MATEEDIITELQRESWKKVKTGQGPTPLGNSNIDFNNFPLTQRVCNQSAWNKVPQIKKTKEKRREATAQTEKAKGKKIEVVVLEGQTQGKPPELEKPRGLTRHVEQTEQIQELPLYLELPHYKLAPYANSYLKNMKQTHVVIRKLPVFPIHVPDVSLWVDRHYAIESVDNLLYFWLTLRPSTIFSLEAFLGPWHSTTFRTPSTLWG